MKNISLNNFLTHKAYCARNSHYTRASNRNQNQNNVVRTPILTQFQFVPDAIRQSVEEASGRNRVNFFDTEGGRCRRLSNEQTNQERVPQNIVDDTGSQIINRNMNLNMIDVETGRSNSRRRKFINPNSSNLCTNQHHNFPKSPRRESPRVVDITNSGESQPIIEDVPVPETIPNFLNLSSRNEIDQLQEPTNIPKRRSARSISKSSIEEYSETRRRNMKKKVFEKRRKNRKKIKEKQKKKRKKKAKRKDTSPSVLRSNVNKLLEIN